MKLLAPAGCASICHDGQIIVVEADGTIEVTKAMAVALASHGFVPCDAAARQPQKPDACEAIDIAALDRAGLFAFLRAHGQPGSRRDKNRALRAAARRVLAAQTRE
ncbi:MAG: hypothetical protein ACYC5H_12220 [Methylovirgula sp.]